MSSFYFFAAVKSFGIWNYGHRSLNIINCCRTPVDTLLHHRRLRWVDIFEMLLGFDSRQPPWKLGEKRKFFFSNHVIIFVIIKMLHYFIAWIMQVISSLISSLIKSVQQHYHRIHYWLTDCLLWNYNCNNSYILQAHRRLISRLYPPHNCKYEWEIS